MEAVKSVAGQNFERAVFYPEDDRFLNRRDENISLARSCSDPTGRRELSTDRTNLYREIVPCEHRVTQGG
jgi:hypothetical protein